MKRTGLGKHINLIRKDKNITSDKLSELCNINATYLRQIECGSKIPSLPVFIDICNALDISADYLLQDELTSNHSSTANDLDTLLKNATPSQQELALTIIKAILKYNKQ